MVIILCVLLWILTPYLHVYGVRVFMLYGIFDVVKKGSCSHLLSRDLHDAPLPAIVCLA